MFLRVPVPRRAVALWLVFAVNGAVLASWAPRIPAVAETLSLHLERLRHADVRLLLDVRQRRGVRSQGDVRVGGAPGERREGDPPMTLVRRYEKAIASAGSPPES